MTKKAYSLHIGLNRVNPQAKDYKGNDGAMQFCEKDARDMQKIAVALNYTSTKLLLGEVATRAAFFENVEVISEKMNPKDLFVLTFSGHGGLVLDENNDEENNDYDQTWCFYDGMVIDDEIHNLLKIFDSGHRILIISDSCYSGDIIKDPSGFPNKWGREDRVELEGVNASVCLLSSSLVKEVSRTGKENGLFTEALLKEWNKGAFAGNYKAFYKGIVFEIPWNKQTPNYLLAGTPDLEFEKSKPFVA